jgi:hypothetical protein
MDLFKLEIKENTNTHVDVYFEYHIIANDEEEARNVAFGMAKECNPSCEIWKNEEKTICENVGTCTDESIQEITGFCRELTNETLLPCDYSDWCETDGDGVKIHE